MVDKRALCSGGLHCSRHGAEMGEAVVEVMSPRVVEVHDQTRLAVGVHGPLTLGEEGGDEDFVGYSGMVMYELIREAADMGIGVEVEVAGLADTQDLGNDPEMEE